MSTAVRICTATIKGIGPYSASRAHNEEKLPRETSDAYEERTWRSKAHIEGGKVVVPSMAFKFSLDVAAKMIGRQIPGKGKSTYTKFFVSGVLCIENVIIGDESAIKCERVYVNADGVRGSGKRVWKNFPRLDNWGGKVALHVTSAEITKDIFEESLSYAGMYLGVGRFRPANGGYMGRYEVTQFAWS